MTSRSVLPTALLSCLVVVAMLASGAASALAAPGWLPPQDLSLKGREILDLPAVAVDHKGDVIAVWRRAEGGVGHAIEAAIKPAGGEFSAPQRLSFETGADASSPQVAFDASGEAVAVWTVNSAAEEIIEVATRPPGGDFSTPTRISPDPAGGTKAFFPKVAVDDAGDAVVVWTQKIGAQFSIGMVTRAAGSATFAAPTTLPVFNNSLQPEVATDPAGDAVVVWRSFIGSASRIEAISRSAGGSFGAPEPVSALGSAEEPAVAVGAGGDAAIAWHESGGGQFFVAAATRSHTLTSFRQPVRVSPASGVNAQVAVDPAGNAVVVWRTIPFTVEAATHSAADNAVSNFTAVGLLSPPGRFATAPRVAFDSAGDAVALWQSGDDDLEANRRPAGGTFGPPAPLTQFELQPPPEFPALALDPAGDGAVVWVREAAASHDGVIQAALYDSTPPELRSLEVPGTGIAGSPLSVGVRPFDVSSNQLTTRWDFGDGTRPASGTAVSHTYASAGRYQVTVTAIDGAGNSTSEHATVDIKAAPGGNPPPVGHGHPIAHAARVAQLRGGKLRLRLRCPAAEACAGTVRLSARSAGKSVVLANSAFHVAAHRSAALVVKLTAAARRLLASTGRLPSKAKLSGAGVAPTTVRLRRST